MNEDQITALAREYAEEIYKGDTDFIDECEQVIDWLLRRYCLVEKNKVEEKYKRSKYYFEHTANSNPTQKQYFWGRICAIEVLFPEIAKEVEG